MCLFSPALLVSEMNVKLSSDLVLFFFFFVIRKIEI